MSNKSLHSNDSTTKKIFYDSIPSRIDFIKKLLNNKDITPLTQFDTIDTECFVGSRDESGSGESYDTRIVLQKRVQDFTKTIVNFGGNKEQLEYKRSGTTGHTFKGTTEDNYGTFEYAVKVVAYPRKEKYGDMYDVRRPENAELKMIKVLSYFVVKRQTPHIVLPIGTFDTSITNFTDENFLQYVGKDNDKYQEFLQKYKDGEYHDNVSVLLSEWANRGDLLDFLRKFYDKPNFSAMHWKSIFFQFLSVLAVIQSKYPGFRHNDLKANNILVHKITKQDEFFTYRIARKKYKVKNIGYQIKLWDFDFACIPGVVDNKKVGLDWTKAINVIPKQNKYYDVHYFFNTLIKKSFVHGIMTSDNVPQEVKDFINRILPKKYQNNPRLNELKKIINRKLTQKYKDLFDKYHELYKKEEGMKKKEYKELAKKYQELYDKCDMNDFGGKFIHDYFIPSEIKSEILNLIPSGFSDVMKFIGVVHEKGRLLVDDEYLTPLQILEEDPYFEEFRSFEDKNERRNEEKNENLSYINKTRTSKKTSRTVEKKIETYGNTPDISKFLTNNKSTSFNNTNDTSGDIKKSGTKKKIKKESKKIKKRKSRTIDDDFKNPRPINISEIFA